jgi:hypothetical protein
MVEARVYGGAPYRYARCRVAKNILILSAAKIS